MTGRPEGAARTAFGLLNGRVRMLDLPGRDRPAVDAPLLAAAAVAPGTILDAGCGIGAVALCVAARLAEAEITALDVSSDAIAASRDNAHLNGWQNRVRARQADLADYKATGFDQVLSNPPFHEPTSTRSDDPARDLARFGTIGLGDWIGHCVRLCRPRGHVALILRADRIAAALGALDAVAGDLRILPIHARAGLLASRVLIRARKSVRMPARILAGLNLHQADGSWTADARAVLEEAAAIDWESGRIA